MSLWLTSPGDTAEVLRWLVWMVLSGWLALPLTLRLAPDLTGFAQVTLAKILGWAIVGYTGWLGSALGVTVFHAQAGLAGMLALVLLWIATRRPAEPAPGWRSLATAEAIFAGLFVLGLAQRLVHPDLAGLEKPTNLAFLTALAQAELMPPGDAWAVGLPINYYYLGHAITAVFTQLAVAAPDHGYQLGMASLFALTGLGVGAIVQSTLAPLGRSTAATLAAFAGAAALYAGNLHSFLYTVLRSWMPTTREAYWYPDSTRFIGFDPETQDRAFTEFTGYAFQVGDLHAHVLATPMFLGAILILLSLVRRAALGGRPGHLAGAALGGLIGLAYGTNAWDVAILGLAALALWSVLAVRAGRAGLDHMLAVALTTLGAAVVVALPFAASFRPFGEGLAGVAARTPPWQLLVVHGAALPGVIAVGLLGLRRRWSVPLTVATGLAAWGLVLIALPEVLRVDDIYGDDHQRANTMFKLTFRAHTLLLMASVLAAGLLIAGRGRATLAAALVVLAPVAATFTFAEHTFALPRAGQTLDGLRHLGPRADLARFLAAVPWPEGASLIEAPSDSFTDGALLATASGRPSVMGWTGHVRLWHAAPDLAWGRHGEVRQFYETGDRTLRCRIIARYDIAYIAVTQTERDGFPDRTFDELLQLGTLAHDGPGGQLIAVDRARCIPEGTDPE